MVRAVKSRSGKAAKATKAGKHALTRVATRAAPQLRLEPSDHAVKLGALETDRMKGRLERHNETKRRNAGTQSLPKNKRQKKKGRNVDASVDVNLEHDKQGMFVRVLDTVDMINMTKSVFFIIVDFFAAIDAPLYRMCGRCGELANSDNSMLRLYDPKSIFLLLFAMTTENAKLSPVTGDSNEAKKSIWLCESCYRSLLAGKTPTFCRSSGFRIASVWLN
jgi:hypothetical protein